MKKFLYLVFIVFFISSCTQDVKETNETNKIEPEIAVKSAKPAEIADVP